MPKLWNETIEAHRHVVRDAIPRTTWELVAERGLTSVTMSQIAEKVGIGRATLYKYFPDGESILVARHEDHIATRLEHLSAAANAAGDSGERLKAVLEGYALISYRRGRHGAELAALLHQGEPVAQAHSSLSI